MDRGGVAHVGFFVAGGDAPELGTIADEAFDETTPFGDGEIAGNPAGTAGLRRDAPPNERGAPPIVGEGRVAVANDHGK